MKKIMSILMAVLLVFVSVTTISADNKVTGDSIDGNNTIVKENEKIDESAKMYDEKSKGYVDIPDGKDVEIVDVSSAKTSDGVNVYSLKVDQAVSNAKNAYNVILVPTSKWLKGTNKNLTTYDSRTISASDFKDEVIPSILKDSDTEMTKFYEIEIFNTSTNYALGYGLQFVLTDSSVIKGDIDTLGLLHYIQNYDGNGNGKYEYVTAKQTNTSGSSVHSKYVGTLPAHSAVFQLDSTSPIALVVKYKTSDSGSGSSSSSDSTSSTKAAVNTYAGY